MREIGRVKIKANDVRSLCWHGDELIDWVHGGTRYSLDGTSKRSNVYYPYKFDGAVTSLDGRYAVIYEILGTKGLVLKDGEMLREINRSYYQAQVYGYPVVLFDLSDGRTVLAHCPDEYNKLEIEDAETGECLTRRTGEPADFFHSRLCVSPGGPYLVSAGWIWHPFETVSIYDLAQVMETPELLDNEMDLDLAASGTEITNAAFADAESILLTGRDDYYNAKNEKEKVILCPDQIGHYSLTEQRFLTIAPLAEPSGPLMPAGDFVVGFNQYPKLIELATGKVVADWPQLQTGNQDGCINTGLSKLPPLALDPANKRFAVADSEKITVIQLG